VAVELSFCVVNTEQRELLVRCLDAIAAERENLPFQTEVLVLDNASHDGSAAAPQPRRGPGGHRPRAPDRQGRERHRAAQRAQGRYALLLNEDSELRPAP
jgi:GT2 family glycosyltransferase